MTDAVFAAYLNHTGLEHHPHQFKGVRWCVRNETRANAPFGVRGGLVADEMGLGKTILMIGTLLANILTNTLIVVPTSLISQWHDQIFKTTGYRPLIYHSSNKQNKKKDVTVEMLVGSRIVITTYAAIAIDKKKKQKQKEEKQKEEKQKEKEELGPLHQVAWSRVVFDEAHHLRNANSRHHGATLLKTDIRWLISGTPVQNKRRDFYNLCAVLRIPKELHKEIPFVNHNFVLRRTKAQVGIRMAGLVRVNTVVAWTNPKERELSERAHSVLKFSNIEIEEEKEEEEEDDDDVLMTSTSNCLIATMRARQICVLPSLSAKSLSLRDSRYFEEVLRQKSSSKIDAVIEEIVRTKDNGNGKLLFCSFRAEIDAVHARLVECGISSIGVLDGRTKDRIRVLEEKKDVLILQIASGCEGLNLQKNYSEIYFVSPHWNPSVEDQAVARCHRIGQTKSVIVKRFEMSNFATWNSEAVMGVFRSIDNLELDAEEKKRERKREGQKEKDKMYKFGKLLQGIWHHEQGIAREIASYFGENNSWKTVSIDRHIKTRQLAKRLISREFQNQPFQPLEKVEPNR